MDVQHARTLHRFSKREKKRKRKRVQERGGKREERDGKGGTCVSQRMIEGRREGHGLDEGGVVVAERQG